MRLEVEGKCWKFWDNIPTDQIVRVDRALGSMSEMAKHVLENLDPDYPVQVQTGDILVAGIHFGQSSGRAVAPKAIKATGVSMVIVEYASRLFYRNCFEAGLPLLECEGISKSVSKGDTVYANMETGKVINRTTGVRLQENPIDPFLMNMLKMGGLIPLAAEMEP